MAERVYRLLRQVGLKPYEAKVFMALLDGVPRTASEISAITGVPQPRVYSILESLNAMGLVDVKLGKPKQFRVSDPFSSIERIVNSKIGELTAFKSQIYEELKKIEGRGFTVEPPDVWVIKSREEAISRVRRAVEGARYEVLAGLDGGTVNALYDGFSRLLDSNSSVSLAVALYDTASASFVEYWRELPNVEVRVRRIPVIPLVIVDSSRAFLMEKSYTLEITEESLLRMLSDFYYHSIWRVSSTVKGFQPTPGREVYFTDIWLAAGFVKKCMEASYSVTLWVEGFSRRDGSAETLEGSIVDLLENSNGVQISFIVEKDTTRVSVGGRGATLENFEGRVFRVTPRQRVE